MLLLHEPINIIPLNEVAILKSLALKYVVVGVGAGGLDSL